MGFNVLSTLRHNGIEYKAGQIITDISDEAAHELISLKVIAPQVEEQAKEDAHTVAAQAETMVNDAKTDLDTVEGQVQNDIEESLKQNDQLKATQGQSVTKAGQDVTPSNPTPEQIAAEAARVK